MRIDLKIIILFCVIWIFLVYELFISGSFFVLEERRFVIFGGFVNVVGFFIWLNEFGIKCLIFGLMCFVICLLLIVLVFLIVEYEFRK